jgi:hypothetical protein
MAAGADRDGRAKPHNALGMPIDAMLPPSSGMQLGLISGQGRFHRVAFQPPRMPPGAAQKVPQPP